MEQNRITIDAHALIWYFHESSRKFLSDKALETIMLAEKMGIIYVPSVALLEILRLIEKGKFPLLFGDLLSRVNQSAAYELIPLNGEILKAVIGISDKLDIHDRTIVATAIVTNTELISMDSKIPKFYKRVIW
ncbi:type II toxin-antitoxin system VapC family toxin [Candidatus Poribacteria bacterium]|nr:type II toxin-antitoxin system VapC family toxin [Candidatus Poribacteria bacterium]